MGRNRVALLLATTASGSAYAGDSPYLLLLFFGAPVAALSVSMAFVFFFAFDENSKKSWGAWILWTVGWVVLSAVCAGIMLEWIFRKEWFLMLFMIWYPLPFWGALLYQIKRLLKLLSS